MRRTSAILAGLVAVALVCVAAGKADKFVEGPYRFYLMNGTVVEGPTKQLPDGSYEVSRGAGITIHVKKADIRKMESLGVKSEAPKNEDKPSAGDTKTERKLQGTVLRRVISDQEIGVVLEGIKADVADDADGASESDLAAPLPVNKEGVKEMVRQAGGPDKAKVMEMPHFVLVYTSSKEAASKLGSRLESVWRWNMRYLQHLKIPAIRPPYKLEVYFFGKHQEFYAYSLNQSEELPLGVLGYYAFDINRSHFFDLWDWPVFAGVKKELEEGRNLPPERRRYLKNLINAWVEHNNLGVTQHEAGHHIHFNTGLFKKRNTQEGGSAPTWLVEGTTMLFEVPPAATGQGGAGLGELNDSRLDELRHFPRWTAAEWQEFVLRNEIWYAGGGASYCKGWALVYYLWMKHRDGLGEYYRKILAREDQNVDSLQAQKDFEDCFGRIDENWVKEFYKFMDSLQVRKSRIPPPII